MLAGSGVNGAEFRGKLVASCEGDVPACVAPMAVAVIMSMPSRGGKPVFSRALGTSLRRARRSIRPVAPAVTSSRRTARYGLVAAVAALSLAAPADPGPGSAWGNEAKPRRRANRKAPT